MYPVPITGDTRAGASRPPITTWFTTSMPPGNTSTGDPGDVFYIRSTDKGQDLQCPIPIEQQHRSRQGAVGAQPFSQPQWHALRGLV